MALQGSYQRNSGLIFWLVIVIVFSLSTSPFIRVSSFLKTNLMFTLVLAISYGLIQKFGIDPLPWKNPFKSIQLTLGNPNFAGALFGLIAIVPLYISFTWNRVTKLLTSAIGVFLIGYLGFCTNSLQSIVLVFLTSSIFYLINCYEIQKFKEKIIRILNYTTSLAVGVITIFVFTSNIKIFTSLKNKFYYQGSIQQRLDYWRTGIEIFKNNPLFGVGPDQYQRFAALYRTKTQVVRDGPMTIPDKAHSVLIDQFANGGIFTGILWLLFVSIIFFYLIKLIRMKLSEANRRDVAALGAIWTGYIFQSLISPDQLVLAIIGYTSAGLLVKIYYQETQKSKGNARFNFLFKDTFYLRTLIAIALSISIFIWVNAIFADADAKKILNSGTASQQEVISLINKWPSPKVTELIAVSVGQKDTECRLSNKLADRLLQIDNMNSQAWYIRAVCLNLKSNFNDALSAVDESLTFDPINPTYLVAKAKLGIAANQKTVAQSALDIIKNNYPMNSEITALENSIAKLK